MTKHLYALGAVLALLVLGVAALAFPGSSPMLMGSAVVSAPPVPPPSGTIACDVGPPYQGSIPNPAAVQGFTHCLNFDFSYTGNFTNAVPFYDGNGNLRPAGTTYNWATVSSWLQRPCCASPTNPLFVDASDPGGGIDPNNYTVVNDAQAGTQVLLVQTFSNNTAAMEIKSPYFPSTNSFIEEIFQNDSNNWANSITGVNNEIIDDFGFFHANGVGLETDFGDNCGGLGGVSSGTSCATGGTFNWVNGSGSGNSTSTPACGMACMGDGNYHSAATLINASLSANVADALGYCTWVDKVANSPSCNTPFISGLGNPCQFAGASGYPIYCHQAGYQQIGHYVKTVRATVSHKVQRITVWTCPGWNTAPDALPAGCDVVRDGGHTIYKGPGPGPPWP